MDRWQAINSFWSGFKIPAYDESSVPDGAAYPYITYSMAVDSLDRPVMMNANVWYRSSSWKEISQKVDDIEAAIRDMDPPAIKVDGGRVYITKGTPFAQRITDPDDMIRRVYINLTVEYFTN